MAKKPAGTALQAQAIQTREGLARREGRIRDDTMYVTAALLSWMEAEWGCALTHVKTSTEIPAGEVSVFRARPGEPGALGPPAQRGSLYPGGGWGGHALWAARVVCRPACPIGFGSFHDPGRALFLPCLTAGGR